MKAALIIPTYQAGPNWSKWLELLAQQSVLIDKVIMVDSSSVDQTVNLARCHGIEPVIISKHEFNHGGTRNYAAKLAGDVDVLIFITQDALLASPHSIEEIIRPFSDSAVGVVCGRQLPHIDANPLAAHARLFNYPSISDVKGRDDIPAYGIKTVFVSNSFTAYRKSVFDSVGGFPDNTILSEDMYLAAKMVLSGYKSFYNANAVVFHSHNYSLMEEFKRYFDIGVFHANEIWIQQSFGGASGEGVRFVRSELLYVLKNSPVWIFRAFASTACKFFGYKLGKSYKRIPKRLRPKLSMYKGYWSQHNNNL